MCGCPATKTCRSVRVTSSKTVTKTCYTGSEVTPPPHILKPSSNQIHQQQTRKLKINPNRKTSLPEHAQNPSIAHARTHLNRIARVMRATHCVCVCMCNSIYTYIVNAKYTHYIPCMCHTYTNTHTWSCCPSHLAVQCAFFCVFFFCFACACACCVVVDTVQQQKKRAHIHHSANVSDRET